MSRSQIINTHEGGSKRFIFEICIHRLTLSVPVRTYVNFIWTGGSHKSQNCNPIELEPNSQHHRINQKLVLQQSFNNCVNGTRFTTVYEPRLTRLKIVEADKFAKHNVLAECMIDLSEFLEAPNDGLLSIPLDNSLDPNASIRISVNVTAFLKGDDEAVSVSSALSTVSEFPGDMESEHKWDPNASIARTCKMHEYGSEDIYKTINRMATKLSKVEREIQAKTIKLSKVNRQNMDEINAMKAQLEKQIAQKDRQIKILVNQLDEMHTALAISHQRELELGGAISEAEDEEEVVPDYVYKKKTVKMVKSMSMDNKEFVTTKRYESVAHDECCKYNTTSYPSKYSTVIYPSKEIGRSRTYVPIRSKSRGYNSANLEYYHHSIEDDRCYVNPDSLCTKVKQLTIPDDDKEYYINQNNKLKDAIRELESELKYKNTVRVNEPVARLRTETLPRSYTKEESYLHIESKNCPIESPRLAANLVDTPLHMRPYGSRIGSSRRFEPVYNRAATGYPRCGVSLNDRSSLPRDIGSRFLNSNPSQFVPGNSYNYKAVTREISATNMVNPREGPPQFHVRRVLGYSKPPNGLDHFLPVQSRVIENEKPNVADGITTTHKDLESKITVLEKELAETKVALAESETKREVDKSMFCKHVSNSK